MQRIRIVVAVLAATLLQVTVSPVSAAPSKAYGTCIELRKTYKNGVANSSAMAKKSGAKYSTSIYKQNSALDTNKNGVACDPFGGHAQEDFKMPNVLCMTLQQAQDEIQDHGVFYSRSRDASGRGRSQWIDSNWIVVAQSPKPGKAITEGSALLSAVKIGESTGGVCK